MKNIIENSKVFEAYVRIDYCYWMIAGLIEQVVKLRSPIEETIDIACGYDMQKEFNKKRINSAIILIKEIIRSKKIINANYDNDETYLNKLLKLQKKETDNKIKSNI